MPALLQPGQRCVSVGMGHFPPGRYGANVAQMMIRAMAAKMYSTMVAQSRLWFTFPTPLG